MFPNVLSLLPFSHPMKLSCCFNIGECLTYRLISAGLFVCVTREWEHFDDIVSPASRLYPIARLHDLSWGTLCKKTSIQRRCRLHIPKLKDLVQLDLSRSCGVPWYRAISPLFFDAEGSHHGVIDVQQVIFWPRDAVTQIPGIEWSRGSWE